MYALAAANSAANTVAFNIFGDYVAADAAINLIADFDGHQVGDKRSEHSDSDVAARQHTQFGLVDPFAVS